MFPRLPAARINWLNSSFLLGTAGISLTAVPWYVWTFGLDPYQVVLFFVFFTATGLSITLGYHRLFAHVTFHASWPVRLWSLIFGAAAFENDVLNWASDHRRHHRHVDHDDDPYNISKGFWHAHLGWILFKLDAEPPLDNVQDLRRDPLVRWQSRWYIPIAVTAGFGLPTLLGWLHDGWVGALGGFLIAGVARITAVQHMTFLINSLCHSIGRQPYSANCSARDSAVMALFTFGEGYHNFHHEFQHDYRNGVKWWQWDPTKWTILALERAGLVRNLRRVPEERILLAQATEAKRKIGNHLEITATRLPAVWKARLEAARTRLEAIVERRHGTPSDCTTERSSAHRALRDMKREVESALDLLERSRRLAGAG